MPEEIKLLLFMAGAAVISNILSIPAWLVARKKDYFSRREILGPYVGLAACLGYEAFRVWMRIPAVKSLGNLVEVPLVLVGITILAYLKTFLFIRLISSKRRSANLFLIAAIGIAILVAILTPMLPE